ncbi:hypothetical protein VNO80_26901 [Phaseolus coccineus]|uniref:Uncharacterized protein n=1 Tax=Phaseolus coccineus TaxID=3886 RepID=A0AAN9LFM7_PHACN
MDISSSSLKRKHSKKLSKAKVSNKSKKIRKNKSKKVLSREVSLSNSDYDDSRSLDMSTSYSSEDSYRRKKDRSHTRKYAKGYKRKARGRSHSRDSSEDSHYARKRKKTKRKNEHDEVRKNLFQKKKIRREAGFDLMSSGSQSWSTCQDGSGSSDDGNRYKNQMGRSKRKEKDRILTGRNGSKRSSRYMARSCSSCSSESSYEATEEKYAGEKNSRRLQSVITMTKEAKEYGELCRNETKEEILDDHDYPYKNNNKSNGGSTRRELDHQKHLPSKEKLSVDNGAGDMNVDLNFIEPEPRVRSCNDNSNLKAYSAGTSEYVKETNETSGNNVNDDDLEKILRQRALENLRKFRGEMQSSTKAPPDQKNKIGSQVKQPITDKRELVQGKSVVNNGVVETKFYKQTPGEETNLPIGRRNLIACPINNERILVTDKEISASAKCDLACALEKVIDSHNRSGTVTESPNYNTTNLELTKQTQKPCLDSFLTSTSHESTNAKLLVTKGDVERNVAKTPQTSIQSINNVREGDVSSIENKSEKLQVESNQGSQFEQKTMNVMRGGEMVQVSYKVYIPNKVPTFARRQVKR